MKKVFIILIVMLITTKIEAHKLTPTSRGYYSGGSLGPNNTIYFSGSTSYDNDSQNGGYSPLWIWDFDYQGGALSFAPNNSSVSHVYTKPGNYTVAVQYRDNDGQLGGIYTFPITIIGMERYYYVKDHLGSIRQTINEDGEIVAAQDYYAYGEIIPGRSYNAGMVDEKYKFTEKERDIETNYDYFGARYYNSKLGLWNSVDPLADKYPGWSPYNYTLCNPLRYTDPHGDTVKIPDPQIQMQHDQMMKKDANGNYINPDYVKQYNTLHSSDVIYNVVNGNLGGIQNGKIILGDTGTKDGQTVTITLDIANGAAVGSDLSHEFVHALQFEGNRMWFAQDQSGKWWSQNMSQQLEYNAFAGQQVKEQWWTNNTIQDMAKVQQLYPTLSPQSAQAPLSANTRAVYRGNGVFMIIPKR